MKVIFPVKVKVDVGVIVVKGIVVLLSLLDEELELLFYVWVVVLVVVAISDEKSSSLEQLKLNTIKINMGKSNFALGIILVFKILSIEFIWFNNKIN